MFTLLLFALAGVPPSPPPPLLPVDTGAAALKLSAPADWEVKVYPPRHKDLSTIASISPACPGGPDISIVVQVDQQMKSAKQLLADQYGARKPVKLHGWDCITEEIHTEVMCAGKLKGLDGVVDVYFATIGEAPFYELGAAEFTAQFAASLGWKGGKPSALPQFRREPLAQGAPVCAKFRAP